MVRKVDRGSESKFLEENTGPKISFKYTSKTLLLPFSLFSLWNNLIKLFRRETLMNHTILNGDQGRPWSFVCFMRAKNELKKLFHSIFSDFKRWQISTVVICVFYAC